MYGYNNNNLSFRPPSNKYPPQNMNFNSPQGNFSSVTTNELNNMKSNFNNFNNAFRQNEPLIEKINHDNNNNLLHNNVSNNILDEHVTEYRIDIDSFDRDIKTYHNPFDFKVKFGVPSNNTLNTTTYEKGKIITINEKLSGPPKPHINRSFKNVKYIKLDNIVLPQYSNVTYDTENEKYILDPESYLVDDRYVSLAINELDLNRTFCTSDDNYRVNPKNGNIINPPCPFARIYPEVKLGSIYYTGTPYFGSKYYDSSSLGNIKSLSIKFFDSCGVPLSYDNKFSYKEIKKAEDEGNPIPLDDLRHPLNKKNQVHLSFIIGVIEAQINTETKFYP